MSDTAPNKVTCGRWHKVCWTGLETALLTAPDPFNPGDQLVACPNCRSDDDLRRACDAEGCWEEATSGTTVPDERRYVQVCGKHFREIEDARPAI